MIRRHEQLDGWVALDAPTALAVLHDPVLWSSDRFDGPRPDAYEEWVDELAAEDAGVRELLALTPQALIGLDPPDHGRLRTVLRRPFAPAAVEGLRTMVAEEIAGALGALVTGEPVDVVAVFTRPVPFRVVARLLGLPRDAWDELETLAHAASTDDTFAEDREAVRARLLAERDVMRFFLGQLETAGDDEAFLLPLLRAAVRDGAISAREAAGLCREVLVAGADSVGHLLAGALAELAGAERGAGGPTAGTVTAGALAGAERGAGGSTAGARPPGPATAGAPPAASATADDRAPSFTHIAPLTRVSMGARPDDLAAFVEHRLAVDPPFTAFWRRATRATTLAGERIPENGLVQLTFAQLNASAARHLSFGHGVHFCLGAALARLEATIALQAILDATSTIESAGPAERLASPQVSGHRRLVLRLTPKTTGGGATLPT